MTVNRMLYIKRIRKYVNDQGHLLSKEAIKALERAVVQILDQAVKYTKPQKIITATEIYLVVKGLVDQKTKGNKPNGSKI